MKYKFEIKQIDKITALEMVKKYHYSNTLPKLNKVFLGFYLEGYLVGMITLGWGTRPLHTIKAMFPELESKDYFEIGRMCMTEEMPKNSESQMLSQCRKWIMKNLPDVKILFTWADGMLGKCGYVYQASNFIYVGDITTDIYLIDGVKIHPRQTKHLFKIDENDKRISARPTLEQLKNANCEHYKGKQFKYLMFLTKEKETKNLKETSNINWNLEYPKEKDLVWKKKDLETSKWKDSKIPNYKTDTRFEKRNNEQLSLF